MHAFWFPTLVQSWPSPNFWRMRQIQSISVAVFFWLGKGAGGRFMIILKETHKPEWRVFTIFRWLWSYICSESISCEFWCDSDLLPITLCMVRHDCDHPLLFAHSLGSSNTEFSSLLSQNNWKIEWKRMYWQFPISLRPIVWQMLTRYNCIVNISNAFYPFAWLTDGMDVRR